MIGKKASQLSSRTATEATTVTSVTRIGNEEVPPDQQDRQVHRRCHASAVCSEERAPPIHAVSGRSRLRTRNRTNAIADRGEPERDREDRQEVARWRPSSRS